MRRSHASRSLASLLPLALPLALWPRPALGDESPGDVLVSGREPTAQGEIDRAVLGRLQRLGLRPAQLCSDGVFVRRVYLDLTGTLPDAAEAWRFVLDQRPDKRARLVDALLATDEFADCFAMRWADVLRIKAEFPINLWPNAASAYHEWLRASIKDGLACDRFARELLTASGSNFRVPQANFLRAVESRDPRALGRNAARVFLGARAEGWDEARQEDLGRFFSRVSYKETREWKEEIVYFDATAAVASGVLVTRFPDGEEVRIEPAQDPREVFADWLVRPTNPWLKRAIVNRVWSWMFGRGVIHEPDDIRPDNPPRNPALLAALEAELVAGGWDLARLLRSIALSHTYQLAPVPRSESPEAEAEFACHPIRRLEAEVLIDALCQVTGSSEQYTSLIPEPYTIVPAGHRAVALPDGSITSPFLELFGRSPRDTGLEAERDLRSSPAQRLHLLNSSHIREKLEKSPKVRWLRQVARRDPERAVRMAYLTVLSRLPSAEERRVAEATLSAPAPADADPALDLAWALINSAEFLFRH